MRDHLAGPAAECGDEDVRDALPGLLHGRLAGAERARVEAHLAGCPACAAEFALLGEVRSALAAGGPRVHVGAIAAAVRSATVPAGASNKVAAAAPLRAPAWAASRGSGMRWRGARGARAIAATLLLALGAGGVWLGTRPTGAPATDRVAVGTPATPGTTSPAAQPSAPTGTAPRATATLAMAEPGLGTRFDDLSDRELQAVVAAIDGSDEALPIAEPDAGAPLGAVGGS